jgi:hypothetical protein
MARKQPKSIHQLAIAQFERMFPDEDACCARRVGRRWPEGVRGPHFDARVDPSGLGNAMALAVQIRRAGNPLSLFPHRWNYFREYNYKLLRDWCRVIVSLRAIAWPLKS